jgi:hypothetical protein
MALDRLARAALLYWLAIFGLGFALGTVRVLVVAPQLGELAAVLVELPVMLGVSWLVARAILKRWRPGRRILALAMGALAFILLLASEFALGVWGFGQQPQAWLAALARPAGVLGLAGQLAFGAIPAIIAWRDGTDRGDRDA